MLMLPASVGMTRRAAPAASLADTYAATDPALVRAQAILKLMGLDRQEAAPPDPYAPTAVTLPTGVGAAPVLLPSMADRASLLRRQAAALAPDPYGAEAARAAGGRAAASEQVRLLEGLQAPEARYTPVDLSSFARPALTLPDLPAEPSARPSTLALAAGALAGLATGRWGQAMGATAQAGQDAADRQRALNADAYRRASALAQEDYRARVEDRAAAIEQARLDAAGRDRAFNAGQEARWRAATAAAGLKADIAGATERLGKLGSLSSRAEGYAKAAADAGAAADAVGRAADARSQYLKQSAADTAQRRMVITSAMTAQTAADANAIRQQNADTNRQKADWSHEIAAGNLAVRQAQAAMKAAAGGGRAGGRTEEQRRLSRQFDVAEQMVRDITRQYGSAQQRALTVGGMPQTLQSWYERTLGQAKQARDEARKAYEKVSSGPTGGPAPSTGGPAPRPGAGGTGGRKVLKYDPATGTLR